LGCEELGESNIDYRERMGQNNSPIRPDGTERKANIQKNNHPTVKPVKLMQYLVRLVTKKGGLVLDPFFGSGTTGIACIKEGMNYIGIERDADYIKIANARIKAVEDAKE
jgi:site-specific DNA-methyltransferase (adenine-specific)